MPNIIITIGVLILSLTLIGKGVRGIKTRKISVAWRYVPAEMHSGTSAVIWGGIYIVVGIIFIISYILIKTDYLSSLKFDWSRLI